jgi:hypothetical protein
MISGVFALIFGGLFSFGVAVLIMATPNSAKPIMNKIAANP